MDREKAYSTLVKAQRFCVDRSGFAGITPETVRAFRFLSDDSSGPEVFRRLIGEGSVVGQMYALAGIYLTDPPSFPEAAQRFEGSTEMIVAEFDQCVLSMCSVSDLGQKISRGQIVARLKGK